MGEDTAIFIDETDLNLAMAGLYERVAEPMLRCIRAAGTLSDVHSIAARCRDGLEFRHLKSCVTQGPSHAALLTMGARRGTGEEFLHRKKISEHARAHRPAGFLTCSCRACLADCPREA